MSEEYKPKGDSAPVLEQAADLVEVHVGGWSKTDGIVSLAVRDVRLTVARHRNGASITARCADGPPRHLFVSATPSPLDDEYLSTDSPDGPYDHVTAARAEVDNTDTVRYRPDTEPPTRPGSNMMTCPECGEATDELRGNRCRACREGSSDFGPPHPPQIETLAMMDRAMAGDLPPMPDPVDYSTYMRKDSTGAIRCGNCDAPIERRGNEDVTLHKPGCPAAD
jgi:hypothetical protein